MKPYKLREMSRDELQLRLGDLREEIFNLRFAAATRALDNPLRLREVRREIARIHTIMREDELGKHKLGVESTQTEDSEERK